MSASVTQSPSLSRTALVSLLLGLASIFLLIITGVPAMVLGLRGLRAVNGSDGRLRGRGLAVTGLVLGGLGTLLTILGAGAIVALRLREMSNRTMSLNNLREIGVSLNKYADANGHFPCGTWPSLTLPEQRRVGWMAEVVPFLGEGTEANEEYQKLARRIHRRKAWDAPANEPVVQTVVRPFLCLGHPDFRPNTPPGLSHYTGLAGVGTDAPLLSRKNPRAGAFGTDRGIKRREAQAGISFCLVAVETAYDNGPWLCGLPATVRGVPRREEELFGPERPFGGIYQGGFHALWLDGSARWLSDATPADLFREQATLIGRDE